MGHGDLREGGVLRGAYGTARRNDHVGRGLDPIAFVVDASAGTDGAEDSFGGGIHRVGVFDEQFGGETEVGAAFLEEAGGARVTID